jgi:hypothetical protein
MPLRTEALVTNASAGMDGLEATPMKNTTSIRILLVTAIFDPAVFIGGVRLFGVLRWAGGRGCGRAFHEPPKHRSLD